MTSVDDLFKKPNLPLGSTKRKFETPDALEVYKAAKLSHNTGVNGAQVEDAPEKEEKDDDDQEAGPDLPPDADEEGGRFFGGGVTKDAAEAIDYIEGLDGETYQEERIDSAWLRRMTVKFEHKVVKNAELRARYDGEPQKFMASEADLDTEIKNWTILAAYPVLYTEFAQSDSLPKLVGLLAHENTDIAIAVLEVINDLTDDEVEATPEQWEAIVTAFLDAGLLELLMSNLARLNEENESDKEGVYHSLGVFENFASQQTMAERVGQVNVLLWLCNRARRAEKVVSQNKQYATEVMQDLLQGSSLLRKRFAEDVDGIDLILQLLAAYRKREPTKDSHEEEYVENLFGIMNCVVDESSGKAKFVEAEGVELCMIMLREGTFSKSRALRLLDHACSGQGQASIDVCTKVVEAAGLKPLFSLFMKNKDTTTTEHLLEIFTHLLRLLPGESAERIRVLAKFTDAGFGKVHKLIGLRTDYARKVATVNQQVEKERAERGNDADATDDAEWFSRRMDGGLFGLQSIDMILAWLIAEDAGARTVVQDSIGFWGVRASLQERLDDLSSGEEEDETKDMLTTLMSFLE